MRTWDTLPIVLKCRVFQWLNVSSLVRLQGCSRTTKALAERAIAWPTVVFEQGQFSYARGHKYVTSHTTLLFDGFYEDENEDDDQSRDRAAAFASHVVYTCKRLETLDLANADINTSEPLPSSLKYLNVRSLEDVTVLRPCARLELLEIFDANNISDLSVLHCLPELKYLTFHGSNITDLSPLVHFSHLQHVELQDVTLSDLEPLTRCEQLESLDLCGLSLPEGTSCLAELARCLALKHLCLAECTAAGRERLKLGTPLEALDLCNTSAQPYLHLETLSLRDTRVDTLSFLAGCPNIRVLDIRETLVTNLEPLMHCPRLTELKLEVDKLDNLSPLAQCPELKQLTLNGTSDRVSFEPLVRCVNLNELNCDLANEHNMAVIGRCTQIDTLCLHGYYCEIPIDLSVLRGCTGLRDLQVWKIPLEDLSFCGSLPLLECLSVQFTELKGPALAGLSQCRQLHVLDLSWSSVTDITPLRTCSTLRRLIVQKSFGFEHAAQLRALRQHAPQLRIGRS